VRAEQPVLYTAAADYTPGINAAIADDADVPTGLSGTSLKLTVNDDGRRFCSRPSVFIAGNRYQLQNWIKTEGGAAAFPTDGNGIETLFGGTLSPNWTYISSDATASNSSLLLRRGAAAGSSFFKPISLRNLSLQSYTPAFTTVAGSVLAQATATVQPWVSSDGLGIRYQGGDMLQWSAAASAVKCLHDGTGGTLIVAVRPVAITGAKATYFSTGANTAGDTGAVLFEEAGKINFRTMNGGAAFDLAMATAGIEIAINTLYVLTVRVAAGAGGVTVRKNSATVLTGALTAPRAADPTFGLRLGPDSVASDKADGIIGHPFVANRVLTDAECTQIENYILAQATL
jgi:hypothetical protein